ncbi:hypothetical protein [Yoonia sp. SS1-5]|uniref:COG4223 family protein n=1 Tax=Yoonia rhodophyticola TaxID=3137370 RepID=A0AAN0ME74_9RHOB
MANQPDSGDQTPLTLENPTAPEAPMDESAAAQPLIDAIPPEVHAEPLRATDAATVSDEDVVVVDPPAPEETIAPELEKAAAAAPEPAAAPAPPPPAQKSGFLPLLLGGVVAGGIGYVAGSMGLVQTDTTLADQVASQSETLAAIEASIAEPPSVDLSGIETAQAALSDNITTLQDQLDTGLNGLRAELDDAVAALDTRVADLESLPVGDGTVSERAISAYEAELEELRSRLEAMSDTATVQLEEARAEAASIEANAEAAARAAAGRAALARVQTALDDGAPLGAALTDLQDALDGPVPDALMAAQDGVPTLASLQESFPEVARTALVAARSADVAGEETSGIGAFFRNQFDVRSVAPREGDDVDAILSRAEAAVKAGRLSDALAETAALPEEARVEMTEWLGLAESRADAIAAVDVLTTTLNDN